jgi:hypothetical protein
MAIMDTRISNYSCFADTELKIANRMDTILSTTATATHISLPLFIVSPPLY